MSINACSINRQTINALCRRRQQVVVQPVVGHASTGIKQQADWIRPDLEQPVFNFEQPFITVSVEFMGKLGTQTIDVASTQQHLVTASDFSVSMQEVQVVATDFSIVPK